MADATQEYMDLGKLEKDVESRRRQVQSPAFGTLPSAVRGAFQASLANATATCEKKKASLNKALNKLSETDFWPSIPAKNVGDMEAKLAEAKTMLGGLADSVSQLYKRIESLYERRTGRSSSGPSQGATVASASRDGDTAHPKKRRRLSVDGGDTTATDMTSPDMREDVESIRDTIREIEDRMQEMENDLTQHSRNIMEQIEAKMDEKIEEIARNADISALVEDHKLGLQTAETIQTFHETFAQADREITELAQEVGGLIPQLDALQRENDLSKQEEASDKELLEKVRVHSCWLCFFLCDVAYSSCSW
jgi:phage shock protein A